MKRKLLSVLTTLFLICAVAFTFTACGTPDQSSTPPHDCVYSSEWTKTDKEHYHQCTIDGCSSKQDKANHSWGEEEITLYATRDAKGTKKTTCLTCSYSKTESYSFTTPTPAQVYTARQTVAQENIEGYDFNFTLSCDLEVLGLSKGVSGSYTGQYRNNKTTGEESFKRTTNGTLFYDSTAYTYTKNSQKIKLTADDDGTIKKSSVLRIQDEDSFFINKAVVSLVNEIQSSQINNVEVLPSGEFECSATLNFGANHPKISKITSLFSKFGTAIAFKNVEFTNPTAIPFYFTINNKGELEDFAIGLFVSIEIKAAKIPLSVTYVQKGANSQIVIPNHDALIVDDSQIQSVIGSINNELSGLIDDTAYSLDLFARNEFDPAWNKLATVDSYTGRMYKNTEDSNVWFNHSYKFKAHSEEDGKESYTYTVGNIKDGTVYHISRKGENVYTPVTTLNEQTEFNFNVSPFLFNASDVDCIEKIVDGTTTTYAIHLNNESATNIQNKIINIINSNTANGVIPVNNYINTNLNIKDAEFIVIIENGKITEVSIKTDIKYNPIGGEFTDYNITLTNELELLINNNLSSAKDYSAPKSAESTLGFGGLKYIL
ncbi:MAG: hypothetical protein E7347_03255 [Clostridiales bacterium]|nr:hypothetical protein [Clostridiales bacterium]